MQGHRQGLGTKAKNFKNVLKAMFLNLEDSTTANYIKNFIFVFFKDF